MPKYTLFLCFFLIESPLTILFAHEESEVTKRWISVTGNGEVETAPDLAILRLGVFSTAKSASLATETNSQSVSRIISILSKLGIDDDDYETTRFQLTPQTQYRKGQSPLITGYRVSNSLAVRIYDLDRVGEIMQAAIDAGGNNFESLSYVLDDSREFMEEARVQAVEDALAKALLMAEALDVEVGKPLSIQEIRRGGQPYRSPMMMESSDALHRSVPVKRPSELSVVSEVQIKFSLQ